MNERTVTVHLRRPADTAKFFGVQRGKKSGSIKRGGGHKTATITEHLLLSTEKRRYEGSKTGGGEEDFNVKRR